jgi:hypothetical protein
VGPLLPITHDPRPAPATTGGVIHDGIYDLTHVVVFGSSKETTRPGVRGAWVVRTEERSSNHIGGTVWQTIEESPDVACRVRRFAVTPQGLRVSGQGDSEFARFTATSSSLTLISDETRTGLFFRRRR